MRAHNQGVSLTVNSFRVNTVSSSTSPNILNRH